MHYNFRRRRVAKAACERWPGNNIPTFKNNKENLEQLNQLVEKLLPECQLPCFKEKQIRQHIVDCLRERRRQIRKGHDYNNKVCLNVTLDVVFHMHICSCLSGSRNYRKLKRKQVNSIFSYYIYINLQHSLLI